MTIKSNLIKRVKERAKKQSLEVNIVEDDIVVPAFCPILGIPLRVNKGHVGGLSNSISLDRIDSTKGYVKGNVWVISQLANQMKSNATIPQLKQFARWIDLHYGLD